MKPPLQRIEEFLNDLNKFEVRFKNISRKCGSCGHLVEIADMKLLSDAVPRETTKKLEAALREAVEYVAVDDMERLPPAISTLNKIADILEGREGMTKPDNFKGFLYSVEIEELTDNLRCGPFRVSYELARKFKNWLEDYVEYVECKEKK